MFNGGNNLSLADIAAVSNRDNNGYGDMMGMGGFGGWWVLIILLAMWGGFGGNGWGNGNGRNNSCDGGTTIVTVPGYGSGFGGGWGAFDAASMQRGFDTSGIISKLDGLNSGVCALGYDQLAQMNGLSNTVQQTGWGISQQLQNNAIANMQSFNALQAQVQDCCCQNRQGQAEIISTIDKAACQSNWNLSQIGQQIMQNDDANYRSLNDTIREGFCNLERQGLIQENQALRQQLSDCNLEKVVSGMGQYVVSQVRPSPVPSYDVPNPYCNCGSPYYNDGGCCGRRCG